MGFGYLQKRGELVTSVLSMGQAFGLNEEVAHDAILLMDRTMSTQIQVTFIAVYPVLTMQRTIWRKQSTASKSRSDVKGTNTAV